MGKKIKSTKIKSNQSWNQFKSNRPLCGDVSMGDGWQKQVQEKKNTEHQNAS